MKLLLLYASVCAVAFAGIGDVGGGYGHGYGESGVSASITINAGETVYTLGGFQGAGAGCESASFLVKNSANQEFTQIGINHQNSETAYVCTAVFVLYNSSSSTSVSIAGVPTGKIGFIVPVRASGLATESAVDATAIGYGTSSPITSAQFTTDVGSPDQLVLASAGSYYAGGTWTADTVNGFAVVPGGCGALACATYKIISSQLVDFQASIGQSGGVTTNIDVTTLKAAPPPPPALGIVLP